MASAPLFETMAKVRLCPAFFSLSPFSHPSLLSSFPQAASIPEKASLTRQFTPFFSRIFFSPLSQALKNEGAALAKKINGNYRFVVDDGNWVLDLKVIACLIPLAAFVAFGARAQRLEGAWYPNLVELAVLSPLTCLVCGASLDNFSPYSSPPTSSLFVRLL